MPAAGKWGRGHLVRGEREALGSRGWKPLATGERPAGRGESAAETFDVYLNEQAYWRNVPRAVGEYTLGGYQVLKERLSYREEALLGRPLSVDEVAYATQVVRRIAVLVLMGPELDANYERVKGATYGWGK